MEISERELEDMICLENSEELIRRGLKGFKHNKLFRQFNLGAYGIADLVGVNFIRNEKGDLLCVRLTIYELKKDKVCQIALMQAARYASAFRKYMDDNNIFGDVMVECEIVLIGSKVDLMSDFIYLAQLHYDLKLYSYSFDLKGLKFAEHHAREYMPTSLDVLGFGNLSKSNPSQWEDRDSTLLIEN